MGSGSFPQSLFFTVFLRNFYFLQTSGNFYKLKRFVLKRLNSFDAH